MKSKIAVLGAGTWGTALARLLVQNGHEVILWSALPQEIESLKATRKHPMLPGITLPEELAYSDDIAACCRGRELLIFAVPSVYVRSTARSARPYLEDGQIIVDVAKGIEPDTLLTMTEIIQDELNTPAPGPDVKLVALSGPTHAEEVVRDIPTTIVSACTDLETAKKVQEVFASGCMRTYTNPDVRGVELCGAMKNIIALAAGMSAGLGYGDNSCAALITRGMAEITRLGVAMGCRERTFSGLAGIGDLIVTATSRHSRNNKCGRLIGEGVSPAEAMKQVGMVVEGVNALPAAMQLSVRYGVDMPITRAMNEVVNGGADPREAAQGLMNRTRKAEDELSEPGIRFEEGLLRGKNGRSVSRVLVYGLFDAPDWEQIRWLRRAARLGDYLIVALGEESCPGCEPCTLPLVQRKALLEELRCVDLVIPCRTAAQLREILQAYRVDTLAVRAGEPEKGELPAGCRRVYLEP